MGKKVRIVLITVSVGFLLYGLYCGAGGLVGIGRSSEEILVGDIEDNVRVYEDSVDTSFEIPYCTLKKSKVLYNKSQESKEYKGSRGVFDSIDDSAPEDRTLSIVDKLDFDSQYVLQYIRTPLEVVSLCDDYTVVYKYGLDGIDYIAMDYRYTPFDSSVEKLTSVGDNERVLVNLNDYILEDRVLYVRGYKHGFTNVDDTLINLYFDIDDVQERSVNFIEGYLSLPYSPFKNVEVYLVSEEEDFYNFAVLYGENNEMMVKCRKGGKPSLIYSGSFPVEVDKYLEYLEIFDKYEEGGNVVWKNRF